MLNPLCQPEILDIAVFSVVRPLRLALMLVPIAVQSIVWLSVLRIGHLDCDERRRGSLGRGCP